MIKALAAGAISFLVAGAVAGCSSGPGDNTGSVCPTAPASTITYENFGQAFVQSHCLACHGSTGPSSPKFDSAAQVRAHASDIDRSAAAGPSAVNTYMPEGSSIDEAERRKLGEWLACGAPD